MNFLYGNCVDGNQSALKDLIWLGCCVESFVSYCSFFLSAFCNMEFRYICWCCFCWFPCFYFHIPSYPLYAALIICCCFLFWLDCFYFFMLVESSAERFLADDLLLLFSFSFFFCFSVFLLTWIPFEMNEAAETDW